MGLKEKYTYVVAAADMENLANPFGLLLDAMDNAAGVDGAKCVARSRFLPSREVDVSSTKPSDKQGIQGIFYATFSGELTPDQQQIIDYGARTIPSKAEYDRLVRGSHEFHYELEPDSYD